jgi:hypothetical protein
MSKASLERYHCDFATLGFHQIQITISEPDAWYKDLRFGCAWESIYPLGLQRAGKVR